MTHSISSKNNIQKNVTSVIIPCFNAEKYIGQAIESVLNQTNRNFELIIINDGSTDKSEEIIKGYCSIDKKIRYYSQLNQGVSLTRNKGIDLSKGEFIAFLDADDVWEPENLEIKTKLLNENKNIDWVFSDMYLADEMLNKIELLEGINAENILESLLARKGEVIHAPSGIVIKKDCLFRTGIRFDPKATPSEDLDLCIRISAAGYKGQRISSPLWTYRVLKGSLSRNLNKLESGNLLIMDKAAKDGLFKSFWFKQQCFSNNYLILAGTWWVNGKNRVRGMSYILRAVAFYPPNLLKLLKKLRYFNLYQAKRKPLTKSPGNYIIGNIPFKSIKTKEKKNVTTFLFHRINTIKDPLWNPIHPDHFEQIISYLKRHFEFVPLKDYLLGDYVPKTKSPLCAVGFDDGYRDFIDFAVPILQKYECPSSMYIVTDCIDNNIPPWTYILNHYFINTEKLKIELDTNEFPSHLKITEWRTKADRLHYARQLNPFMKSLDDAKRCSIYKEIIDEFNDVIPPNGLMLSWDEIRELKKYNCEVGSHTVNHPMLSKKLSYDDLLKELKESASIIEKHTGVFPLTISYPFGAYNNMVKKAAFDAGYKIGVTVNPSSYDSTKQDLLEIPRIELFDEPFFKTRLRINQIMPKIRKILTYK